MSRKPCFVAETAFLLFVLLVCGNDRGGGGVGVRFAESKCGMHWIHQPWNLEDYPPNEGELPPGTYVQSCAGCKVLEDGVTLFCKHCMYPCGVDGESSVRIDNCKSNFFENIEGHLHCHGKMPKGSYKTSCSNCKLKDDDRFLYCEVCYQAHGFPKAHIELELHGCERVGNHDAALVCEDETEGSVPAHGEEL